MKGIEEADFQSSKGDSESPAHTTELQTFGSGIRDEQNSEIHRRRVQDHPPSLCKSDYF